MPSMVPAWLLYVTRSCALEPDPHTLPCSVWAAIHAVSWGLMFKPWLCMGVPVGPVGARRDLPGAGACHRQHVERLGPPSP